MLKLSLHTRKYKRQVAIDEISAAIVHVFLNFAEDTGFAFALGWFRVRD